MFANVSHSSNKWNVYYLMTAIIATSYRMYITHTDFRDAACIIKGYYKSVRSLPVRIIVTDIGFYGYDRANTKYYKITLIMGRRREESITVAPLIREQIP